MKTTVVNIKREQCEVYIGRKRTGFHFGNPFTISKACSREQSIKQFEDWLYGKDFTTLEQERRAWIWENINSLKGKKLGCFCAPLACHGDIYVRIVEGC